MRASVTFMQRNPLPVDTAFFARHWRVQIGMCHAAGKRRASLTTSRAVFQAADAFYCVKDRPSTLSACHF